MRFDKIRTTMIAAALALAACAVTEPAQAFEQSLERGGQPRLPEKESLAIVFGAEQGSPSSPGYQHWAFKWVPYAVELAETDIAQCRSFVAMVKATAPEIADRFERAVRAVVPKAVFAPSS